jgi:hypothetical protein
MALDRIQALLDNSITPQLDTEILVDLQTESDNNNDEVDSIEEVNSVNS